ncbi:alkylhydroperoxidase family enzyme [Filimonas zeae]|nr:hypothetical protein [Filimonas zeae]MDR6338296.1 alkylhydroperoxidase family enzyme [Filimonas zeae]
MRLLPGYACKRCQKIRRNGTAPVHAEPLAGNALFTEEEQAILALTEEVTLIHQQVSDATYDKAITVLGEKRTADVIVAAIIINAWNRIGVSTHMQPALSH